jgi:hypothetical protein
VNIDDVHQDM